MVITWGWRISLISPLRFLIKISDFSYCAKRQQEAQGVGLDKCYQCDIIRKYQESSQNFTKKPVLHSLQKSCSHWPLHN